MAQPAHAEGDHHDPDNGQEAEEYEVIVDTLAGIGNEVAHAIILSLRRRLLDKFPRALPYPKVLGG